MQNAENTALAQEPVDPTAPQSATASGAEQPEQLQAGAQSEPAPTAAEVAAAVQAAPTVVEPLPPDMAAIAAMTRAQIAEFYRELVERGQIPPHAHEPRCLCE